MGDVVFLGVLSNVNSSILNLELEHGFKVESIEKSELNRFISNIKRSNGSDMIFDASNLFGVKTDENDKNYYIITNDQNPSIQEQDDGECFVYYYHHYLWPLLRKIRLYSNRNVYLNRFYVYYSSRMELILWHEESYPNYGQVMVLDDEYTKNMNLIKSVDIPFNNENLNLAFEHYEQSFRYSGNISFLLLMTGIEILVSPSDRGELVNRISRNMAVLISENLVGAEKLFREMKELYAYRSKIVHNGKGEISNEDFIKLRRFLSKAILEINSIYENETVLFGENGKVKLSMLNKIENSHDKILYMLNCTGFGEKLWK